MDRQIIRMDLGGVNAYLVKQNGRFLLVDTGGHLFMDKTFDDRRAALVKALEDNGCGAKTLKLILLTHGDNDHVANAAFIKSRYGAPIAMHPGDLPLTERPTAKAAMENCKYRSLPLRLVSALLRGRIEKLMEKTLGAFEGFTPDCLLHEGFDLSAYGFDGRVIETPGHTKGSVGLLLPDGAFVAGDTFANLRAPGPAPNAADFTLLDASIQKIKGLGVTTVYPGHGAPLDAALLTHVS